MDRPSLVGHANRLPGAHGHPLHPTPPPSPRQMADASQDALPVLDAAQVYATLLISYDGVNPDVGHLGRAGHPAFYERSTVPSQGEPPKESRTGWSLFRRRSSNVKVARRRLQMQFPRSVLSNVLTVVHEADPTTVEDVQRRRGGSPSSRKFLTVFDSERAELVAIRDRDPLCRVATRLFSGNGVHDARLFYPPESVVASPAWSSSLSASLPSAVMSPVKWATLSILTPPPDGKTDNSVSKEEEKLYLATLNARQPTDEELLAQLSFKPSKTAHDALDAILRHLHRRGCIWTRAAHRSRPSLRNPDPKARPEFMVQGMFTEAFLSRCKRYQVNDNTPMPSDMDESLAKERPLITTLLGVAAPDEEAAQAEAKIAVIDALQGCSVRISPEPYRGAGSFEESVAWGMV